MARLEAVLQLSWRKRFLMSYGPRSLRLAGWSEKTLFSLNSLPGQSKIRLRVRILPNGMLCRVTNFSLSPHNAPPSRAAAANCVLALATLDVLRPPCAGGVFGKISRGDWPCFQSARGCFPARQCASICSRVLPLVSGTRKNAKSHAPILTTPYNQNVGALPRTCVSVKKDKATIKLAPQLAIVPTLMARPRMPNG